MPDNPTNLEILEVDSFLRNGRGLNDEQVKMDNTDDAFTNFLSDAGFAGAYGSNGHQHLAALREETAQLDAQHRSVYTKIATDTRKPDASMTTDSQQLVKRFSMPDQRTGYRQFFKTGLAAGKTATSILDEWHKDFPHANPDVIKLMGEVAGEFE